MPYLAVGECEMAKRPITIYIELSLYERIKKTKQIREKLLPPGWPKISSYSVHLIEEGLRVEEATLQEVQRKGVVGKSSSGAGRAKSDLKDDNR
jgi:hypothetical protein